MCTYRTVRRSLLTAATAGAMMTIVDGAPAAAQLAMAADSEAWPLSIVVAGDAVVWAHHDAGRASLFSAMAPDYHARPVSSATLGDPELVGLPAGSLSPDGLWILYLRDGLLYRMPANGGASGEEVVAEVPLFETIGLITDAAWSPDGSRIAFVMAAPLARHLPGGVAAPVPSFVGVFDLGSGQRWFLSPSLARDASPVWSPDGAEIFFQRSATAGPARLTSAADVASSSLMVGDVESGEVRTLWSDTGDAVVLIDAGGPAESRAEAVAASHPALPPLAGRAGR